MNHLTGGRLLGARAVAMLLDQIAGPDQRIKSTGIGPPALEITEAHRALMDIGIVDVGDLELAARGWLERASLVENRLVIHIDAGHSVIRFRLLRFLFDAQDAIAFDLGHSKALGIVHLFEKNLGTALLPAKIRDR